MLKADDGIALQKDGCGQRLRDPPIYVLELLPPPRIPLVLIWLKSLLVPRGPQRSVTATAMDSTTKTHFFEREAKAVWLKLLS